MSSNRTSGQGLRPATKGHFRLTGEFSSTCAAACNELGQDMFQQTLRFTKREPDRPAPGVGVAPGVLCHRTSPGHSRIKLRAPVIRD